MAVFDWAESRSSGVEVEPKIKSVKFGDGYEQRAPAGLNNLAESWSLTFEAVDDVIGNEIETFFRARAGYEAFDWTPKWFVSAPIRVVCRSWRRNIVDIGISTITAQFDRVYEP